MDMPTLTTSVFLLVVGTLVNQVASMPPWKSEVGGSGNVLVSPHKADCETKRDGYYPDYESGCRSYYFCSGGFKATYLCANEGVFDGTRCVSASQYQCPSVPRGQQDCVGLSTGYYHDLSTRCRNYFFCLGGFKMITLTCSGGRLFDGKKCVDPASYLCPFATYEERNSPNKLPPSYSSLTLTVNPSDTQGRIKGSQVQEKDSGTTEEKKTNKEETPYSSQCEAKYGFFVDKGSRCRNYHFCINGIRTNLSCSRDMVFNGQVCVNQQFYHCPESAINPVDQDLSNPHGADFANLSEELRNYCLNKSDGVYVNRSSGCKNYFLCTGGLQVSFNCPDGLLFDGHRCVEANEVVCSPAAWTSSKHDDDDVCAGRMDGFYSDDAKADCRSYIHCKQERKIGAGQCPDELHFSSSLQQCVAESQPGCRMSEPAPTTDSFTEAGPISL